MRNLLDQTLDEWDPADLPANIRFGRGCRVERPEVFERFRSTRPDGLVLGDDVLVYTWTSFNVDPDGSVEVGDGTVLVGAVFMCAERIVVGRRCVISYQATIADSDFHPVSPDERRQDARANAPEGVGERPPLLARPVVIEDDVVIGIGAIVLKGVVLGAGCRIGAGAVVTSDVPPGALCEGNPGRVVG